GWSSGYAYPLRCFVGRFSSDGQPIWGTAHARGSGSLRGLCTDEQGGVFASRWNFGDSTRIQHFDESGTPLWGPEVVLPGQDYEELISDETGGVWMRGGIGDYRVHRFDSDGARASGSPINGT